MILFMTNALYVLMGNIRFMESGEFFPVAAVKITKRNSEND